MPTTILNNETIEQARSRRFAEEAAVDARVAASIMTAYSVVVRTAEITETLNVLAFTTCDAIVRAIDILFDGEQPLPCEGLAISAFPLLKKPA